MVSAIVCITIHLIKPMTNHDIGYQIIMIHQITILHKLLTLRRY